MSYRLGDIGPNPFRNVERYPIDRSKVEALKASINRTSFWENIVARPSPDGRGKIEIAYGHHRLVALSELYSPDHKIELILRNLDDAAMLHIMADENMQEWHSSTGVVVETVRAVRDYLSLSGARRNSGQRTNGVDEVTQFLGDPVHWSRGRVERAMAIIDAEEAGNLTPEDTAGLDLRSADELRKTTSRIQQPEVRQKAITAVRTAVASGDGYRRIPEIVNEVLQENAEVGRQRPAVASEVAERLYRDIDSYWLTTVQVNGKPITRTDLLRLIAEHRNSEELTRSVRPWADQIADALVEMASEATRLADLLRAEQAVAIGA